MDDNILIEVKDFIETYKGQYRRLFAEVRSALNEIKTDNLALTDKIKEVYGRDKKQGGDELKSIPKIALKLADWRRKNPDAQPKDIHDIVGLTVVLHYSDDIDPLVQIMIKALVQKKIVPDVPNDKSANPSYHRDFGYHATHLRLVSHHDAHKDLKIEVQFKTMLHDAWGAKTHDLTYKPKGIINPKIKRVMESIGDSLQAIEVQSESLRDMVFEQNIVDAERRRLAITQLAHGMNRRLPKDQAPVANDTFNKIQKNLDYLSKCGRDDLFILKVREEIEANQEVLTDMGPAKALLNVWLACVRTTNDLNHVAQLSISELQSYMRKTNRGISFFWAAMLNYFILNLDRAIACSREGLAQSDCDNVTREKLTNNLCYFLVESCVENPPDIEKRRSEANRLRDRLSPDQVSESLRPAAAFTLGYYDIIFGAAEEDILRGVRKCETAYDSTDQKPDDFVSLLIQDCRRAAWRRILNLDVIAKSVKPLSS